MENRKEPSLSKFKLTRRDSLCEALKLRIRVKWYRLAISMLESALNSMQT